MKSSTSWTHYYENLYADEQLGFYLDLSDAGFSDDELETMIPAFKKALSAMQELEQGVISNPDENRQVGHYWLRNPAMAPEPRIRSQIEEALTSIKSFSAKVRSGKIKSPSEKDFTNILLIGIGGSALGPQFISDALGSGAGLNIDFLDNTDPDGIDRVLQSLSPVLDTTLVVVISKSGGTAETRNGMLETRAAFDRKQLDFTQQAVAITGLDSQLDKLAHQENWLASFPMWDWVGGRTSVMSVVGLLPAALQGIDIEAFLAGGRLMDERTRLTSLRANPAALLAVGWYLITNGTGSKDMVILPYKDRLLLFSRYLQQLIMESLGKELDLAGKRVEQGIAVYGNKGSTDQHAYVQQLRDGLDNFFVTFIEVLKSRETESMLVDGQNTSGDYLFGFLKGTQTALREKGRCSLTITVANLSPKSVGALIALYERAVGFYASFVNINAYHQPGVEAGKQAAGDVLNLKHQILVLLSESSQKFSIEEIVEKLRIEGKEALVYQILRHYAANNELLVEGSFHDPEKLRIGKV